MAVEAEKSVQITNSEAEPIVLEHASSLHGVKRIAYFNHVQSVAGDVLSTVAIVKLPPGTVRLLGLESWIRHNWTIALVDMDIGWQAYTDIDGNAVAASPAGLDSAIDVDAAGTINVGSVLAANAQQKVFQSRNGVTIEIKAQAAGLALGDTVEGYLTYVQN